MASVSFKRVFFCLTFLWLANILVVYSQAPISSDLQRKIKKDAARLFLRESLAGKDASKASVNIDKVSLKVYQNILTSIYSQDSRSLKLNDCNIRTFPDFPVDNMTVVFVNRTKWAQPLKDGGAESTNASLNNLISTYNLVIERYFSWDITQDAITLKAREPLNMKALADDFSRIEGVKDVNYGTPQVSGNDIQVKKSGNGFLVDFILRFGQTGPGKFKSHVWTYQVSADGKIKFLGEKGDTVPTFMKCADYNKVADH
jgi:hypothetical protein